MTSPRDPRLTWWWQKQRAALLRAWGPHPTCWRCGDPVTGTVVVGHRIDQALGGTAHWSNLAPECLPCSRRSGGELRSFVYGKWRGRPSETTRAPARIGMLGTLTATARPAPEPPPVEPPAIF